MANSNWTRWIFASLADYLTQVAAPMSLPILIETDGERTDAFMHTADHAEVRITGPFLRELSCNYFQAYVDVNILITSRFDGNGNAYDILKYAGAFASALDQPISVWNYGNEPGDYVASDPTSRVSIGYLMPRFGQAERTLHFGQIDVVDQLRQTEVEARYLIELEDSN